MEDFRPIPDPLDQMSSSDLSPGSSHNLSDCGSIDAFSISPVSYAPSPMASFPSSPVTGESESESIASDEPVKDVSLDKPEKSSQDCLNAKPCECDLCRK